MSVSHTMLPCFLIIDMSAPMCPHNPVSRHALRFTYKLMYFGLRKKISFYCPFFRWFALPYMVEWVERVEGGVCGKSMCEHCQVECDLNKRVLLAGVHALVFTRLFATFPLHTSFSSFDRSCTFSMRDINTTSDLGCTVLWHHDRRVRGFSVDFPGSPHSLRLPPTAQKHLHNIVNC